MKTLLPTLAIALALFFSFSTVAQAALTEGQKCKMKADLLTGKFSLCLSKADAKVSRGKRVETYADDARCESKFVSGWEKTREKAQDKDATLGADCDGAMSNAVRDSVEASALIAAGRDLTLFEVTEADLAPGSAIPNLIEAAVAAVDITTDNGAVCTSASGTYDAGADTCAVDITSDNQTVCETAGGSWDSGTCTAVSSYNCTIGAMCSAWAAAYPGDLPYYTNNHVGYTATSTGCAVQAWDQTYGEGFYSAHFWHSYCPYPVACGFWYACE